MVLEISGRKKGEYAGYNTDTTNCVIPNALLRKVWGGVTPEIIKARIDGNKIKLALYRTSVSGEEVKGIGCIGTYGIPVSVKCYTRDSQRSVGLDISLPKNIKYDFVFKAGSGFHSRVDGLFGTREKSYLSTPGLTLEDMSLKAPDSLEVQLEYKTPAVIWRALPNELLEAVNTFMFRGPFLRLDSSNGFKQLGVSVEYFDPKDKQRKVFDRFRDQLTNTGLVRYVVEEGIRKKESFIIDSPPKVKDPRALQILEDISRQIVPEADKIRDISETSLSIQGNMCRNIFYLIPKIFDNKQDIQVNGVVKGENIHVESRGFAGPSITLKDATFEDAERLTRVGAEGGWTGATEGCSLEMRDNQKRKTYDICKEVGKRII